MDYEKKYKDALEKARKLCSYPTTNFQSDLEDIFPELAESDDEKIRKALIETLKYDAAEKCLNSFGINKFAAIAWLEKQAPQEQDGFEAELNALLKKYEHLPKHELADSLEFYLKVVNKSEAEMVVKGLNNEWNYQNVMQMLQSIYEVLVSINNKNAPVQIVPYTPPTLAPFYDTSKPYCNTTNKIENNERPKETM